MLGAQTLVLGGHPRESVEGLAFVLSSIVLEDSSFIHCQVVFMFQFESLKAYNCIVQRQPH